MPRLRTTPVDLDRDESGDEGAGVPSETVPTGRFATAPLGLEISLEHADVQAEPTVGGESAERCEHVETDPRSCFLAAPSRGMKMHGGGLCPGPALGSGDPGQGLLLGERRRVGRFARWASSPGFSFGRPCDLPGLCCEHVSVCVVVPLVLPLSSAASVEVRMGLSRWVGRAIGLDVHRDFCVVAICEEGEVRTGARVPSTPEGLAVLAESLLASDRVALEVTGQLLGGGADPRAARRSGGRGQPGRHRDHAGAREDRPARRAHAGAVVVVGRAGVGVDARRALPRAATPAGAARATRALAHAREERDPRRAAAPPAGQAAVLGPVRRQGPPVAGRA